MAVLGNSPVLYSAFTAKYRIISKPGREGRSGRPGPGEWYTGRKTDLCGKFPCYLLFLTQVLTSEDFVIPRRM